MTQSLRRHGGFSGPGFRLPRKPRYLRTFQSPDGSEADSVSCSLINTSLGRERSVAKFKLLASLVLAVLGLIIVLQNTNSVETRLLFITVTMPQAILLFTTTMVGFALGVLVALILSGKRKLAGG